MSRRHSYVRRADVDTVYPWWALARSPSAVTPALGRFLTVVASALAVALLLGDDVTLRGPCGDCCFRSRSNMRLPLSFRGAT